MTAIKLEESNTHINTDFGEVYRVTTVEVPQDLIDKVDKNSTDISELKGDLTKVTARVDHGLDDAGIKAKAYEATQAWLTQHPEATTTVQEGSISESKIVPSFLKSIKNDYVTPEMFGAKGDGVTDDTVAIKDMFASSSKKFVLPNSYKISEKITLKNKMYADIDINTLVYTGDDYAVEMLNTCYCNLHISSLTADNGGGVLIISKDGKLNAYNNLYLDHILTKNECVYMHSFYGVQYINLYLGLLGSDTCNIRAYAEISSWCNEIKYYNGQLAIYRVTPQYSVFGDCASGSYTALNRHVFINTGIGGTVNGIHFENAHVQIIAPRTLESIDNKCISMVDCSSVQIDDFFGYLKYIEFTNCSGVVINGIFLNNNGMELPYTHIEKNYSTYKNIGQHGFYMSPIIKDANNKIFNFENAILENNEIATVFIVQTQQDVVLGTDIYNYGCINEIIVCNAQDNGFLLKDSSGKTLYDFTDKPYKKVKLTAVQDTISAFGTGWIATSI